MTHLQLDGDRPVDVFYPVDRERVPAGAIGYRYTPEDTLGPVAAVFPPGVVYLTEVADAWVDVTASGSGPYPVVVLSHGWGATRFQYSYSNAHLASWGFVVAAPEDPLRNLQARLSGRDSGASDVAAVLGTIDLLGAENTRAGSLLEGRIDADRVAVEGHSAGGRDAALAAYSDKVDTWIGLSPSSPVAEDATGGHDVVQEGIDGFDPSAGEFDLSAFLASATPPDKPSLMVVADNDVIYPVPDRRSVHDWLPAPKRFVVLADTGHVVYFDACADIQKQGGLQAVADALGLDRSSLEIRLSEDGCLPQDAPVDDVVAVWNHLTVAQLNWVFTINPDVAAASLQPDYLDTTFPGRISEYLVEP